MVSTRKSTKRAVDTESPKSSRRGAKKRMCQPVVITFQDCPRSDSSSDDNKSSVNEKCAFDSTSSENTSSPDVLTEDEDLEKPVDVKKTKSKIQKERKSFISSNIYTINWSGTKNAFVGLDIQFQVNGTHVSNFQPTVYLAKTIPAKNSGIYLTLDEFKNLTSPMICQYIESYFKNTDERKKPYTAYYVSEKFKITFKQLYTQKCIMINEILNAKEDLIYYPDSIILQEQSWNTLIRVAPNIISTLRILETYSQGAKKAYDCIVGGVRERSLQKINLADFGNLSSNVREILKEFEPFSTDFQNFNPDPNVASKLYQDVKVYCEEVIVANAITADDVNAFNTSLTSSDTQNV